MNFIGRRRSIKLAHVLNLTHRIGGV